MASTTTRPDELERTGKTASARLLDLLAGWSAYVSADEENNLEDPILTAEDIGDLYQSVGPASEDWQALGDLDQAEAVSAFVTERIIPLLIHGRAPGKT